MIKILLGGSPCTYWSIAQKNNRETEPSGLGWELFKNYLIAKEKFKPDFFLYENNKSAAQAIKDEIKKRFGVDSGNGARYIEINSALVSAQNRQRFYVHNCGDVGQPEDRGILLRDILESGQGWQDKSHAMTASYDGAVAWNTLERHQRTMVAEPVRIPEYSSDKARPLTASYKNKGCGEGSLASDCFPDNPNKQVFDYIAEPGACRCRGRVDSQGNGYAKYECRTDGKGNALDTNTVNGSMVAEPIRIGDMGSKAQAHRIYSIDGKSVCINSGGGGLGAKTGLYAIPTDKPVYEVRNGLITIKDKQYPIKLKDGYYIIRKLTVTECCRLQTMPDDYCRAVSNSQAYKGLGNGWTAEVIIHILNSALKDIPRDTPIKVLSMYDGIGTGRYVLDKMGFTNIEYHAYEIDKYAMQIATSNYPDIIQHGDAYAVRNKEWRL